MKPFSAYRGAALQAYETLGKAARGQYVITKFSLYTHFASDAETHIAGIELFTAGSLLVAESVIDRRVEDLAVWSPSGISAEKNMLFDGPFPKEQSTEVANVAAYLCDQLGKARLETRGADAHTVCLTVIRNPGGYGDVTATIVYFEPRTQSVRIHFLDFAELQRAKQCDFGRDEERRNA